MDDPPHRSDPWSLYDTARGRPNRGPDLRVVAAVAPVLGGAGVIGRAWIQYRSGVAVIALVGVAVVVALLAVPTVGSSTSGSSTSWTRRWQGAVGLVLFISLSSGLFRRVGSARDVVLVSFGVLVTVTALSGFVLSPTSSNPGSVSGSDSRRRAVSKAPILMPLGLWMATQVLWLRTGKPDVVAVMVAVTAVAAAAGVFAPDLVHRIDRIVLRGVRIVVDVVVVPIVVVVGVIILYIPGYLQRLIGRAGGSGHGGRTSSRDGWEPTTPSPEWNNVRKAGEAMFAATPRRQRRQRTVQGLLVLVACAVALLVVVAYRQHMGSGDPGIGSAGRVERSDRPVQADEPDDEIVRPVVLALDEAARYSELPAYAGVEWADDLQRAQGSGVPNPFFNLDSNGDRRTLGPRCDCPGLTVWFTGGSAAVGIGQRDEFTIASDLVRLGERDGLAIDVVNIARNGALFVEEAAHIEQRLDRGEEPDLIIVYNGWNDVLVWTMFEFEKDHGSGTPWEFERSMDNLNAHLDDFLGARFGDRSGGQVVEEYTRIKNRLDARLAREGIPIVYYFQPDAFTQVEQLEGFDRLGGISPDALVGSPFAVAADRAASGLEPGVTNLRHLFDNFPRPTFLGLVHQNEIGAAVVAERIYSDQMDLFVDLAT